MRKVILMTAACLLIGTGVAVAHGFDAKSIRQASATFGPTTTSKLRTSTCTGTDGTYAKSVASYSGTFTSTEPSLNGPGRLDAASLINTTTGVGTVWGELRIDTTDGRRTSAHFEGVLAHGSLVGLAEGHTRPGPGETKVLANISADYTTTEGFKNGKLGGGTAAGEAILITRGGCEPQKAPKPERIKARGGVSNVSSTSITVAGVSCNVPTSLQSKVANLKVGDRVEIECEVANGANTLTKVSGKGHDRHDD
jgi:hypothetical protein